VTKVALCRWCGGLLAPIGKMGRPRQFCKRSCRQRDFEARQRAKAHGLDEAELIITRTELEELRDKLFVLRCAVQDVERDLTASKTLTTYKDAVRWLIESARPLLSDWPQRP
jgi:5-bromo-4-chloroindolyl phosphate hydrolysis protein